VKGKGGLFTYVRLEKFPNSTPRYIECLRKQQRGESATLSEGRKDDLLGRKILLTLFRGHKKQGLLLRGGGGGGKRKFETNGSSVKVERAKRVL